MKFMCPLRQIAKVTQKKEKSEKKKICAKKKKKKNTDKFTKGKRNFKKTKGTQKTTEKNPKSSSRGEEVELRSTKAISFTTFQDGQFRRSRLTITS